VRACSVVHWQPRTSLMRNCITRKTGMSSCHAGQIKSLHQARRQLTRTPHNPRPQTHLGGSANDGHGLCFRPHLARAGACGRQRALPRGRRAARALCAHQIPRAPARTPRPFSPPLCVPCGCRRRRTPLPPAQATRGRAGLCSRCRAQRPGTGLRGQGRARGTQARRCSSTQEAVVGTA
jgi:hypothetical protein